jgi:O-antigen/teichoic acid export membrane protein
MRASAASRLTASRTSLAGLQQIAAAAGNGGFLVVTARLLPAAERGALATYVVVIGVTAGLAAAGWPSASLYFTANGSLPMTILRVMTKSIALFSILAGSAAYIGLVAAGIGNLVQPSVLLALIVSGIALSVASTGAQWTVMGLGRFAVAAWARLAASVYLVAVPLALQALGALTLVTSMVAWASAWLLSLAVMARVALPATNPLRDGSRADVSPERVRAYAFRSLPSGLGNYLSARIDQWVVAAMVGLAAAGSYSVALGLVEVLALAPQALAAALFAGEARGDVQTTMRTSVLLPVAIAAAAALALALIAPVLVPLVFGEEYSAAVAPAQLLAVASVLLAAQRAHGAVLAGRGYPGVNSIASMSMAAVLALSCWFLIPSHGLNGAAVASILSYGIGLLITLMVGASRPKPPIAVARST